MSIKTGDLAKITTKNTAHYGKTGKVVHVFEDEKTVTVQLEENINGSEFTSAGVITGFFISELEIVKGVDEDEQIAKIRSVLYNEPGNEEWDMEQSHKAAESLYKAGIRVVADKQ
jgi:hypothetical protein